MPDPVQWEPIQKEPSTVQREKELDVDLLCRVDLEHSVHVVRKYLSGVSREMRNGYVGWLLTLQAGAGRHCHTHEHQRVLCVCFPSQNFCCWRSNTHGQHDVKM